MSVNLWEDGSIGFKYGPMTPEMAERLLGKNVKNRNVRDKKVAQYARDMVSGNWSFTGNNNIVLGPDGRLLDGQHRLKAVIKAQVTVPMGVFQGVDCADQKSMDQGAKRTFSDVFKLNGIANAALCASASKWLVLLRHGRSLHGSRRQEISCPEALECYHSSTIGERAEDMRTLLKTTLSRWGSAFCAIWAFVDEGDEDLGAEYGEFLSMIANGGVYEGTRSPVAALFYETMLKDREKREGERLARGEVLALISKAWRDYVECDVLRARKFSKTRWVAKRHRRVIGEKEADVGGDVDILR